MFWRVAVDGNSRGGGGGVGHDAGGGAAGEVASCID
jgi:hypothetical protein